MWPWLCIMAFYELIYLFLSPCSYPPTFLLLWSVFHSTVIITSCKNFSLSPSSDISTGSAISCDRAFSILLWSPSTSLCMCLHFPSLLHSFKRKRVLGSKTLYKSLNNWPPSCPKTLLWYFFSVFIFFAEILWWELLSPPELLEHHAVWLEDLFELSVLMFLSI